MELKGKVSLSFETQLDERALDVAAEQVRGERRRETTEALERRSKAWLKRQGLEGAKTNLSGFRICLSETCAVHSFDLEYELTYPIGEGEGMRLSGAYGVEHLCAYSEREKDAKEAFLHEARRVLTELGKRLGWESGNEKKSGVRVNPGGVAVGGDVYGVWFPEGEERGIYVNFSGDGCWDPGRRSRSGVSLMARTCTRKNRYGGLDSGPNRWLSYDSTVGALKVFIHEALGLEMQKAAQVGLFEPTTEVAFAGVGKL